MNQNFYIPPFLRGENSLNSFLKSREEKDSHLPFPLDFDDLISTKRAFLLGEPGYGKSRLLQEIVKRTEKKPQFQCCLIDLKKVSGTIEEFIKKKSTKRVSRKTHQFSSNFTLKNEEKIIICLDALDEVNQSNFLDIVDSIIDFATTYDKVQLIISCRTHHLLRNKEDFEELPFEVVEIFSFSIAQTAEFLKKACPALNNFTKEYIYEKLNTAKLIKYNNRRDTIATPRYLTYFAVLVEKHGLDKILTYSRSKLFEEFINNRIKEEEKKKAQIGQSYSSKIGIVKRVLEKLALVMELQRVNTITKEDFDTFLEDTSSSLLNQLDIEVFFDGTILNDKGDFIEFDNTEFQEYLAAKAIVELGNPEHTIYDVAIEPFLEKIYPSWRDVIPYLIEIKSSLLLPLLELAKRLKDSTLFFLIGYADMNYFSQRKAEKDKIFELIFQFYITKKSLFDFNLEDSLAPFYNHRKHQSLLITAIKASNLNDYDVETFRTNVAILLAKLFQNKNLFSKEEKKHWKSILKDFVFMDIKNDNRDVMQRFSLKAYGAACNSIEELDVFIPLYGRVTNSISYHLLSIHKKINPNHYNSINLFLKNLQRRKLLASAHFSEINTEEGAKNLFKLLIENSKQHQSQKYSNKDYLWLIKRMNENPFKELFNQFDKWWGEDLQNLVCELLIILGTERYYANQNISTDLVNVFKRNNNDAIFIFIDKLPQRILDKEGAWFIHEVMNRLFDFHQVDKLLAVVKQKFKDEKTGLYLLRTNPDKRIKNLEQKYFPEFYKKWLETSKSHQKRSDELGEEQNQWSKGVYKMPIKS